MCSDLMIHKKDVRHPALLNSWKAFVMSNEPTGETWSWLMDHYEAFDHPDNLDDQLEWLIDAGMNSSSICWSDGPWACVRGVK